MNRLDKTARETVSLQRAAEMLDVHEDTLRRWWKSGRISIERIGRKLLRVPVSEVARLQLESEDERDQPILASKHQGYVYFVESGGLVKIGVTCYLQHRVRSIQTHSAVPVRLRGFIPFPTYEDAQRAELALHERFGKLRRHGEWFAMTDDDVAAAMLARNSAEQLIRTDPHHASV